MAEAETDLQQLLCDFVQTAILHPDQAEYEQLISTVQSLVVRAAPRAISPPTAAIATEEEIERLTWILYAMSSTAASLHEETHEQVLRTLFQLHFWHTPMPILTAWTDLLLHLLYARPAFHQPCINHLVRNFYPPPQHLQQAARDAEDSSQQQPTLHTPSSAEVAAHQCIIAALNHIVAQHPLLRDTISFAVSSCAPHRYQPRVALCAHFRAVFALAESPAGSAMRDALLFGAAEKLVEMDCDIRWEGIVQQLTGQEAEAGQSEDEGDEEDLFAVDTVEHQVEDLHLDRTREPPGSATPNGRSTDLQLGWEGHAHGRGKPERGAETLGAEASSSLAMAHKLDPLLLLLFQHMHARAADDAAGGAPRLWRACVTFFERVLQLSQRVKFTPYIMFLGARLAGVESSREFAAFLVSRACSPGEHKVCRTSCAAYAASFLARFAPLPLTDVISCIRQLADFCSSYATSVGSPPRRRSPSQRASTDPRTARPAPLARRATMPALLASSATSVTMHRQASGAVTAAAEAPDWERHEVFYAACQAAMYSLCYHMHVLEEPESDKQAAASCAAMRKIVSHSMVPLMGSDLRPLDVCLPTVSREFVRQVARHGLGALPPPAVPPELMTRHGGRAAFEMFFPFDPFLLPVSAPALDLTATFRSWRGGHVVPDAAVAVDDAAAGSDGDGDEDDDTETRDGDRSSGDEASQLDSDEEEAAFGASVPSDCDAVRLGAGREIVGGRRKVYDVNPFAAGGAAPMSMEDRSQYEDMLHTFAGSSPAGNEWLGQSPGSGPALLRPGAWHGEAMSLSDDTPWGETHAQPGGSVPAGAPLVAVNASAAVGGGMPGRRGRP